MGVYTDFTIKASHTFYYSFTCQHCGKKSGTLYSTLTAVVNKRKSGLKASLTDEERHSLSEKAQRQLADRLQTLQQDTNRGIYNNDHFKGKCPHCGKDQRWSGGSFFSYVLARSFLWACGLGFLLFVPYLLYSGSQGWNGAEKLTNAGIALTAIFAMLLVFRLLSWVKIRLNSQGASTDSTPEIQWNL